MVLPAAWFGWKAYQLLGPLASGLVSAGFLSLAVPIMRSCLIVNDEGLIDRRAVRTVRVPWQQIAGFSVERPGRLWGGFCVVADCRNGTQVDLLSVRAYSRAPSAGHLDDLHLICWTLTERLAARGES
jgi:Bacterial PH domain